MKNILVPIGTSPNSVSTLRYAVDFAVEFSANIFVMEVFSVTAGTGNLGNVTEKVAQNNIEHLKSIIAQVDPKGVEIKLATYNGDIEDGVKQIDRELGIDLIIIAPRSNDINEELYLGHTSGRIIKQTDIPALIVPKGTEYKPFKNILTAFKSGILKRADILYPLEQIKEKFSSKVELLLVKTPGYTEEDLVVDPALTALQSDLFMTDNATTYQGVLEFFRGTNPDLLCVFRRKRGFFTKLWEKNTIAKTDFFVTIPVLVLSVKKD